MQADISDESAIAFSEGFYGRLVRGAPLEECMYMGRKNILATTGLKAPVDWAAPVLFMRTDDGKLFEIEA